MQAQGNISIDAEVSSLRQEVQGLLKELDTQAQGADHPEVKRFACKYPSRLLQLCTRQAVTRFACQWCSSVVVASGVHTPKSAVLLIQTINRC